MNKRIFSAAVMAMTLTACCSQGKKVDCSKQWTDTIPGSLGRDHGYDNRKPKYRYFCCGVKEPKWQG